MVASSQILPHALPKPNSWPERKRPDLETAFPSPSRCNGFLNHASLWNEGTPPLNAVAKLIKNFLFYKKIVSLPSKTSISNCSCTHQKSEQQSDTKPRMKNPKRRDVAQLVACNVRDVEVASSNLVIPTKELFPDRPQRDIRSKLVLFLSSLVSSAVEQLTRNEQVESSNLLRGSSLKRGYASCAYPLFFVPFSPAVILPPKTPRATFPPDQSSSKANDPIGHQARLACFRLGK